MLKDKPISAGIDLKHDEAKDGPDEVLVNGVALWVHMSGPRRTIRMRDDRGEIARSFAGFQWFPVEEKYRVTGRLIKDQKARQVNIEFRERMEPEAIVAALQALKPQSGVRV
jgi:uncharacterized protein (DUF1684 family)